MKVVSLQAENFKRLRAVEITPDPDGNLVVVAGRNAQGKTSVLESMWAALGGGAASKSTPRPIRDGEDTARVELDLGDITVTRTWTDKGTQLKVTSADGAKYSSPQSMLDELVGRLAFDPLAFAGLSAREQRQQLLDLIDLPFDLADLDRKRAAAFDARTDINRTVKQLDARRDAMIAPAEGTPVEEVSAADLIGQLQAAQSKVADVERLEAKANELAATVARLAEQLEAAKKDLGAVERELQEAVVPDTTALEQQLASVEDTNREIRAANEYRQVTDELDAARRISDDWTEKLTAIDTTKAAAIADAAMPVEGLGFDEEGVTYQGVPFSQASAAEQLRVSMAVAMALNPKVRVVIIRDGSLLDADNLALIETMAAGQDFQVWVERVGDGDGIGVLIEDGQVV